MEIGEFFATFGSGVFIFIVIFFCIVSAISKKKAEEIKQREKHEAEQNKQRSAENTSPTIDEQRRRQEELKQRLQQKYAQAEREKALQQDAQAAKHAKHVEDSHAHAHLGEEEHYEEIVGSLGEVNDEGCEDLSGVRFIATDLAYESDSSDEMDYSRLARTMVLGEVLNHPRFKQLYSRRK